MNITFLNSFNKISYNKSLSIINNQLKNSTLKEIKISNIDIENIKSQMLNKELIVMAGENQIDICSYVNDIEKTYIIRFYNKLIFMIERINNTASYYIKIR